MHGLQRVTYLAAGLAGDDIAQPGRVRVRERGGDDLDTVAVAQLGAQGDEFGIHFGGDAAVADVGVHAVGEIHCGRAARQRVDLAFGREDIHFIREQVDLQVLQELDRIAALREAFQQALQPLVRLLVQVVDLHFR